MPEEKNKGGKPSLEYNERQGNLICELLANGESLRAICSNDDYDLPSRPTIYKWLNDNETFANQYMRAREEQADGIFDEILEIADQYDTTKDIADKDTVQRARLRIDARKWMAGKLRPKRYGDKVQAELTGSEGGAIKIEYNTIYGEPPQNDETSKSEDPARE